MNEVRRFIWSTNIRYDGYWVVCAIESKNQNNYEDPNWKIFPSFTHLANAINICSNLTMKDKMHSVICTVTYSDMDWTPFMLNDAHHTRNITFTRTFQSVGNGVYFSPSVCLQCIAIQFMDTLSVECPKKDQESVTKRVWLTRWLNAMVDILYMARIYRRRLKSISFENDKRKLASDLCTKRRWWD